MEDRVKTADDNEATEAIPIIEAEELNPEGYGIEDEFVPTAVFEDHESTIGEETQAEGPVMEEGSEVEGKSEAEGKTEKKEEEDVKEENPVQEEKDASLAPEDKAVKFETDEEEESTQRVRKTKRKSRVKKRSFRPVEKPKISGDFSTTQMDTLDATGSVASISSYLEEDEHSDEEEAQEAVVAIDREYYYALHKKFLQERNTSRMKNNFLHRKMAEYFKKRKMEHVLKETNQQVDSQQRYDRKLDALSELKQLDTRERNSIIAELNDMRTQRDDHLSLLNVHFTAMQNREKETGTGLINTKTGKEIPDKLLERLVKRQTDKMMEIATMRLAYIKLRDRVTEKKVALHKLDTIGDNLHLIDFEQLQIEHSSHSDKIEERDEELTKLRAKCSGSMQCLAHVREKSAALQIDLQQLVEQYDDVSAELTDWRERLNYVKQERDNYRMNINKLIAESGLLTKPKLLLHMEEALDEIKILEQQIEEHKVKNEVTKESVKAIKINMRNTPPKDEEIRKNSHKIRVVYKRRPTLHYPKLPPA